MSLSDFMVQTADEAAVKTIEQHESWVLSEQERDVFMAALLNPPEPGPKLVAAALEYRKRMGAGD
jgi:uncharacterized protein (DUF1778 family)